MKKFIALIVTVVMIIGIANIGVFATDNSVIISISDVSAKAGENINVKVSLKDCAELTSLSVRLSYDETVFELIDGSCLVADVDMKQVDAVNKVALLKFDGRNVDVNGDIFEINFAIKENAEAGDYEIGFDRVVVKQKTQANDADIAVSSDSGIVTIKEDETTTNPPVEPPETIEYSLGDVNGDDEITASDARLILRASAELEIFSAEQFLAADVDGNNEITAFDARTVLRIAAELDSIDNYIKNEPPVDEPPVDERIDLSVYFGWHVDDFSAECPEFVFDEDGHAAFDAVAVEIDEDGYIYDIVDTGSTKYSIYGVCAETPYDEARMIFENNGFVFEDNLTAYNAETGINLMFTLDDMVFINIFVANDDIVDDFFSENELFQYLGCSIEDVESDFGELEYFPETEDYFSHYYVDGIYFYVDEFNIVTTIDNEDNENYCILDIYIGSDLSYVTEILDLNGIYYTCYDESVVIADDYLSGFTVFISFDENSADYIGVYSSYYNLADYHMTEIESLLSEMPYLEKTDNLYQIPEFTFEVNDEGYVKAIILKNYNSCNINGLFIGMDADNVLYTLEEYGFTYNYTDEDGYIFYNNSEANLDMYVIIGEDNEVVCVCLY